MGEYDIAVVGFGGIFPGASNNEQFWKNILGGKSYFAPMPDRKWPMRDYCSADPAIPEKTYTRIAAFVEDFEFPFLEYRLPPNSLKGVDISQLVSMEAAKHALADAGIAPHAKILEQGVTVIGNSGVDEFAHATAYYRHRLFLYRLQQKLSARGISESETAGLFEELSDELKNRGHRWNPATIAVGSAPSSISNRVAQVFGIHGFNQTVDAACSSTMTAVDTACHALMAGDARVAVAGGCDMGLNPPIFVGFCRVGGLSFSGKSNPFDQSADGLVMGEGCGMLVLKRLEDALADGDRIRGVIRGIGSSSDGAGQAIYSPSVSGRVEAFHNALEAAAISPDQVQYIEAHATSTVVGDANEYDSISTVYGQGRSPANPLFLGSIKYQIGHLKAAAGAAGLIKTLLAMEHGVIPHLPDFKALTSGATKVSSSIMIPTEAREWPEGASGGRIAAVTTSGFGGVNYHCILENRRQWPARAPRPVISRKMAIIGMTARVAGADSAEEFWQNSVQGKDAFSPVDEVALDWQSNRIPRPQNEYLDTKRLGRINDFPFNAMKFRIFPKSLSQISPTQLLGLELSDQLLNECGLSSAERKSIGVSVGSMHDDYYPKTFMPLLCAEYAGALRDCPSFVRSNRELMNSCIDETVSDFIAEAPPTTEHTLPGWMTNITSGRIANKLNLGGPNFIVDSACSSGVAAFLPAMYQLMFGKVDMMITGGINRQTSDVFSNAVTQIGAVAEWEARPYDREGRGFIIGEGGALFLLKRLDDARRDKDSILGILHNVSGSSEARSKTMLAPTEEAIRLGIRNALSRTEVSPEEIGVVDTHGSANLVSDVAEARSVAAELRSADTDNPVQILATKSHIGHLYGGSGATSMMTVVQSLRFRIAPGIRRLETIRPELDDICRRALPRKGSAPLSAETTAGGVNSLGLGGSNYFAVLTGADWVRRTEKNRDLSSDEAPLGESFARYLSRFEPELGRAVESAVRRFKDIK